MDSIQKLLQYADDEGVEVILNSDKVIGCMGWINFSKKVIHIANMGCEEAVVLTLLHELGHWSGMKRSAMRYGYYSFEHSTYLKEIDAYKHGFQIANQLNINVSKNRWRTFHWDEIEEYMKYKGCTPIFTPRKKIRMPWILEISIFCLVVWVFVGWRLLLIV